MEGLFKEKMIQYLRDKGPEEASDALHYQVENLRSSVESENNRSRGGRLPDFVKEHNLELSILSAVMGEDPMLGRNIRESGRDPVDVAAHLRAHEALTPEDYVMKAWRNAYGRMSPNDQERYSIDEPPDWKRNEYNRKYNANPPSVHTGLMPVAWDDEGKPTDTVSINVVKKTPTGPYVLRIDGKDIASWNDQWARNNYYGREVSEWYRDNDIRAAAGTLLGPSPELERMEQELEEKEREFETARETVHQRIDDASNNAVPDSFNQKSEYGNMSDAFEQEIEFYKRSGIQKANLIERNEQWRIVQIEYMFTEMARRGIPRMFFFPGTATGARGGFITNVVNASRDMIPTDKIQWTLETKELRGQERNVVIVTSEDMQHPLWIDVTNDNLIPFNPDRKPVKDDELSGYFSGELTAQLGRYVAEDIARKMKRSQGEAQKPTPTIDLLTSRTPAGMYVIHTPAGEVIASVATEEEANRAKSNYTGIPDQISEDRVITGSTNRHEIGVPIHLLRNTYHGGGVKYPLSHEYRHTVSRSTMEGGRRNYDLTFMKILREYSKRFGMTLEEGEMKVNVDELHVATQAHGLPEIVVLDAAVAERFQNVNIEEVTGENYGWVINSDGGVLVPTVFPTQQAAADALLLWISDNRIPDTGRVKTYQITMSEKAKEHHKKAVSPFIALHYKENPILSGVHKKIGSNEPRLVDRFNDWRKSWRADFNVGAFDKLYGILHAMNATGNNEMDAAENPYVQARMTTGLESIMRGLMEYGHPVRREGIIENDGAGLLEILQPIAEDVELWSMYMAGVRAKRLMSEGREKLFTEEEIDAMVELGETFPQFKDVAKEYAEFNKKILDFAEASGVINPETRPVWENADYIPFYRMVDDRLVGPLAKGVGIANQRSPIKTLKGGTANVGDLVHSIFMNMTNLMDASIKNHAALLTIDTLKDSGIIQKIPYKYSKELVPMGQVKKILQQNGIDAATLEAEVLTGVQTMFALQPPEGPGIISVMRKGKKEFYHTEDDLLYRSLSAINMKAFGAWMNLLRTPKRLLTTWVTLDPGFMIANWVRDSMSAFVLSRDNFVPIYHGITGFNEAITQGETMRAMIGAGAAFESGYINQGDPTATSKMIKRAMKDKGFTKTVLDTPRKMYEAWKRIGSAAENANRIAVYDAAIRSGKSKAQAAFESKDLMDFSMGGDWPFIQFLIQTVPFMGARMQGLQRLGRGAIENPVAFATKGLMVSLAGMSLWFAFRDDDRYKDLEDWDKDTYFHWWIGDNHFRLPKGFEVGAIFNTIPERIFEYMYSNENDAGKLLMRRWGFMLAETFNMNPMPQTFRPLVESWMNRNFFRDSEIETKWEEDKLPPDRHRYYTSPTMIELAAILPKQLDLASQKIRSPLHLQNLYAGYTGTLGRYALMASDAVVRHYADYPERPEMRAGDYPVSGRFFRGSGPRRTRYEEEFYHMLRTTLQVQDSLRQADRTPDDKRYEEIEREYAPYIDAAEDLESFRKEVSALNREVREINTDTNMTGKEKRQQIDAIQVEKNKVFREAYRLRPSARPENKEVSQESVEFLIDNFNVDAPEANDDIKSKAPVTADLVGDISSMPDAQLQRLEKANRYEARE
jgi:hypothetical protein